MSKLNNISDNPEFERWVHPEAKKRRRKYSPESGKHVIWGMETYEYLQDNNLLDDCLSLSDLENIKERGITFFEKHFNRGRKLSVTQCIFLVALKDINPEYAHEDTHIPCLHTVLGGWGEHVLTIGYYPLWSIASSHWPIIRFVRR